MMKVVESGYKIDLHIHSIYSNGKDKGKVSFNTPDNIDFLADKLNQNQVQICAITDHDMFGYDVYKKLKKYEDDQDSSITKVFPGIEFSVKFQRNSEIAVVVHVIAIFNDEDDGKVQQISSFLTDDGKTPLYDEGMAFSEEKFLMILRSIDIDTILIAHQKSSLSSTRPYKNDVRSVGEKGFKEFIYTDYFEAFEFKNRKNEVFNKNFLNANNLNDDIRFITGSDCHDWCQYPKIDDMDSSEFKFSYVKCLPNFRGLVMAITDHRRIKTVNSFFNPTEIFLPEIKINIESTEYTIPLSRGINVIIGDNSIGKSLLLHKLTGYSKNIKTAVKKGYDSYFKKNNVNLQTVIPESEIFAFDMQGEIREKFDQGKLNSDDFLKDYYPAAIHSESYREKIQRELNRVYEYLEEKYAIESKEAQLSKFQIIEANLSFAESLTFVGSVSRNRKCVEGLSDISSKLDAIIEKFGTLLESNWLEKDDINSINKIIEKLNEISKKYVDKKRSAELENKKIGLFQAAVNSFKQKYRLSVSDSQKKLSAYQENMTVAIDEISDLIIRRSKNITPKFSFEKEIIKGSTNRIYDYEFNSRLSIIEISPEYINELFSDILKKGTTKSIYNLSQEELVDALPYYQGPKSEVLKELKVKITEKLDGDFSNKFTITQAGTDKTQELSAGFNSKIYFDILSYEEFHKGVYIIDQPEDNVSQKSIRGFLLDRFKVMGEIRQVIIVTHNPQFIVNLDVDNVIYLGRNTSGLFVESGALEYKNNEYNVLDIVSTQIEGGLDTLKRRWKRYEKNPSI